MVFLEECVKHIICSSNNITSLSEIHYYLQTMAFIPKYNPFAYAALFLTWHGIPLYRIRHYFGEYPLQNDGRNWLRRLHNSFISDKRNVSFRERAGLKNITNKEDWTFPIGTLDASRKLSSMFAGTCFFDPQNAILSDRITAICKQYSHPYRIFREYCVDALHFLT